MSQRPPSNERETILVLADLIQSQMRLEEGVVAIYNQTRVIPPTSGLFIDIAIVSERQFGNTSRSVNNPDDPDMTEIQGVNVQEQYQIDIFSSNASARLRKVEIIFALTGNAAQQAQERYAIKIANLPTSFVDLSQNEGSRRLNRYAITFNVLSAIRLERRTDAFTIFQNPPKRLIVNP